MHANGRKVFDVDGYVGLFGCLPHGGRLLERLAVLAMPARTSTE